MFETRDTIIKANVFYEMVVSRTISIQLILSAKSLLVFNH